MTVYTHEEFMNEKGKKILEEKGFLVQDDLIVYDEKPKEKEKPKPEPKPKPKPKEKTKAEIKKEIEKKLIETIPDKNLVEKLSKLLGW